MKYTVSGRQPYSTLKKADEIKVQYKDKDIILDYIEKIPDKTIILDIPVDEDKFPWETLLMYRDKIDLILGLRNLHYAKFFSEQGFKWYWPYPIVSFDELREVAALGPCYLLLGVPLCFSLDKVRAITDVPIRLTANVAYEPIFPRENGITGRYIRPEDVKKYEQYVAAIEFIEPELEKERTLLHVYKDNAEWPGNLNLLIKGLNCDVSNRVLPEDFADRRMVCGHRCKENGRCKFCQISFRFANAVRNEYYRRLKDDN
jgi:hypothetical protein